MYNREWFRDNITQQLLKDYITYRDIAIGKLIEAGQQSSDPQVQEYAVSIRVYDTVIREINKKGKTDEVNENEET